MVAGIFMAPAGRDLAPASGGDRTFGERILDGFRAFQRDLADCSAGVASGLGPVDVPAPYGNSETRALCKALGAVAGLGGDAFVGATGAAEIGGGAVISTTGVGAIVGAPAAALGAAQVTVAAAGTVMHSKNLSDAISEYRGARSGQGASSGSPQQREIVRRHDTPERARNRALEEVGDLGHDRAPVTGRLGAGEGKTVGFRSADGKRGFRLDYDPEKGIHYNWYDWTNGNRGTGGRWGAETFPGDEKIYLRMLETLGRR